MKASLLALGLAAVLSLHPALAERVHVVAAENFYGDLAKQIGGVHVEVTSILTNPDQDPHLFESSPETAKAIARADVVVANGADYDPWMQKLMSAQPSAARRAVVVADLVGAKPGDNPHLWYSPSNIQAAAKGIAEALAGADPADAADFRNGEAAFRVSLRPIEDRIAAMRKTSAGVAVAATEPVFGYAADAIGLDVREQKFALAVMNDAEPSPSDVAKFETDLKQRMVRALIYNAQASEPAVERLVALARANKIPVVGVSETEPPNTHYQDWVLGELEAPDHALATPLN